MDISVPQPYIKEICALRFWKEIHGLHTIPETPSEATPTISYISAFFPEAGPKCRPLGFSLSKNFLANASLTTATGRVLAVSSSVMGRPITILSPRVSKKYGVTRFHPMSHQPAARLGFPLYFDVVLQTQLVSGAEAMEPTLCTPGISRSCPSISRKSGTNCSCL